MSCSTFISRALQGLLAALILADLAPAYSVEPRIPLTTAREARDRIQTGQTVRARGVVTSPSGTMYFFQDETGA